MSKLSTPFGVFLCVCALVLTVVTIAPSREDSASSFEREPAAESSRSTGFRGLFDRIFSELKFPGRENDDETPAGLEEGPEAFLLPGDEISAGDLQAARPWQAPEYERQVRALGWTSTAFSVPAGFESRVGFWRDIYSRYTTDQGVLHDSVRVDVVYSSIDFSEIMKDSSLSMPQKRRAREKLVDGKREEIRSRLIKLSSLDSARELEGEDLRIWKLWEKTGDRSKMSEAAKGNRIRFQLGQKDRIIIGVFQSGRYLRRMEQVFRSEGLPIELTRLPFVESSFNLRARSRVGASGIWQFMPRTARGYLKVAPDVDERNDPMMATLASAKLLKQNFQMLQSWPLAVTGYNHGAYGVRGIVNRLGTNDLVEIVERYSSKRFGFASENFYACFLAILEVESKARTYLGEVKWAPELELGELRLTRPLSWKVLERFFDGDESATELGNPHFNARVRSGKVLIPVRSLVRVPKERLKLAETFSKGQIKPTALAAALLEVPIKTHEGKFDKVSAEIKTDPSRSKEATPAGLVPASASAPE